MVRLEWNSSSKVVVNWEDWVNQPPVEGGSLSHTRYKYIVPYMCTCINCVWCDFVGVVQWNDKQNPKRWPISIACKHAPQVDLEETERVPARVAGEGRGWERWWGGFAPTWLCQCWLLWHNNAREPVVSLCMWLMLLILVQEMLKQQLFETIRPLHVNYLLMKNQATHYTVGWES